MKKTSKQNVSANEKLARVVERCGPVLLSNVPMATYLVTSQQKLGYAAMTFGIVMLNVLIGTSAWFIRTKLKR